MPYYRWRGIDLQGAACTGVAYAQTIADVQEQLLTFDVALLSGKPFDLGLWLYPITIKDIRTFFSALSSLLSRGVFLRNALGLLYTTTKHPLLQARIYQVIVDIERGTGFAEALAHHCIVFDSFIIQLVKAGEASGSLPLALAQLCEYLEEKEQFTKQVRTALLIPALTLLFFIAVVTVILLVLVPMFATLFGSIDQLPATTQQLLWFSVIFSRWYFIMPLVASGIFLCWCAYRADSKRVQFLVDWTAINTPMFGRIMLARYVSFALRASGLLLERGIAVVPAFEVVSKTVGNRIVSLQIQKALKLVQQGIPLAQALFEKKLVDQEGNLLLQIGQVSGSLGGMLMQVAQLYQERITQALLRITTLLQPLLMVVLGLLIMWLIAAVYTPLLHLSTKIGV